MEKLLEAFRPYIAQHKHFDLTLSKFGPVYVYPVDRQGELFEAEVLDGPKEIIETVAFQMICDITEPFQRIIPNDEEIHAVRLRIRSMLGGLESESESERMAIFEKYVSHFTDP